ncbi:MAG TPA: hypothetical protein VFF31_03200 [Blastocatellia bacterium]|nr:hypothetical protein [Blastocatellia bacterium]
MNEQENIKNDEINVQTDALTDLPVADEQADRARGGFDPQGRLLIGNEGGIWR